MRRRKWLVHRIGRGITVRNFGNGVSHTPVVWLYVPAGKKLFNNHIQLDWSPKSTTSLIKENVNSFWWME